MEIPKVELNLVHKKDLRAFLQSLNVLDRIERGEVRCAICGDVLTIENIALIYSENGRLQFSCRKTSCYEKAIKRVNWTKR